MRTRLLLVVLFGLVVLLPVPATAADHAVSIPSGSNTFAPSNVTVRAGDSVTWTDNNVSPHSITADNGMFDSHPDCSGSSTTACMKLNEKFTFTFQNPGTYRYHCKIHGGSGGSGMSGTVVVQVAQTTILPTTTPPTTSAPTTTAPPRTTTTARATTTTAAPTTTTSTSTTSSTTSTTSTTVGTTTTTIAEEDGGDDGGGNGGLLAALLALIAAVLGGGGYVLWQMRPDGPGIGPWRRPPS